MARNAVFVNPPLTLPPDFIDYPWFADHGMLACAALAARAGWAVRVADAFAMAGAGRLDLPSGGYRLGASHEELLGGLPDCGADLVVLNASPFLRIWRPDAGLDALIAGLRERWPRAALVAADCHVGGMHHVEYDADALIAGLRERWPRAALVAADCHVGGMHHVEYDADAVIARLPAVDAVLRYSGEEWFAAPDRLAALAGSRRAIDAPAGADWPGGAPAMPMLEALDGRAWGTFLWHCFEDGRWANAFGVDAATRPFMTTSGCPHRCVFCTSNPGWRAAGRKPYRVVPLKVVETWAFLAKALGARRLFVLDEMANLRPDFEAVLDAFAKLDLKYEFPNGLRADRLSDAAIERLAGRTSLLCVSAESASQADLDGPIGKRQDLADVDRVAARAAAAGVPCMVHWVVGFPWETKSHVRATIEAAWALFERHGARPAVQFATPLPGTALHASCVEQGLVPPAGFDAGDGLLFQHRPAFATPALPAAWLTEARDALAAKVEAASQRKVIVNVTYECINRCTFCAVSNRVRRAIPWPRLERIIADHRARGIENLDLDGGEPTLHPRLAAAVRHARSLGFRQVNVTTNGRRLADRKFARRLLAAGPTSLLISLHGHTAAVHDALTRVPGSFDETVAGIRNAVALKAPALDLGVNVTVATQNVGHLPAIADLAYDLGVRKLNLQLVTPFGRAGLRVVPPMAHAVESVREVLDRNP
ncbi:MAG: radical SAM protein, partial [Deltaproteobacteria bacterium]|nr:radical SAM protein [Deltaproteobacteria bacterium]